jgi:hypothetical protein
MILIQDRFNLFSELIPLISETSLHLIVTLIPEAVLGTKEPSDKARSAAFQTILAMGQKMKQGGVVKRNMIDGMDQDGDSTDRTVLLFRQLILLIYTSYCKHRRVFNDDGWWFGWCHSSHDQRNRDSHLAPSF